MQDWGLSFNQTFYHFHYLKHLIFYLQNIIWWKLDFKVFQPKIIYLQYISDRHHDTIYYIASFFKSCLYLNKIKICYYLQLSLFNYLCIIFQYYKFNFFMIKWSFLFSCLINSLQIPMVHTKRDSRNLIHIHYFHIPDHNRNVF